MPSLRLTGLAVVLSLGLTAPAGAGSLAGHPDISGMWRLAGPFQASIKTVDGKAPPLTTEGRKVYLQRAAERKEGKQPLDIEACLPPGTPRIMWADHPFLVLQTPHKITFVHEYLHILRHIYLDEALPKADDLDQFYGGTSAGRWVGNALVIESAGFNDKTQLDQVGLPNSPDMKVVEKLQLTAGGKVLEDRVTITDPANYTRPWTAKVSFRRAPGVELKEDVCAEKLLDPALRVPAR